MFSVLSGSGRRAATGVALVGLTAAPVALFALSAPFAAPARAQAGGKQEFDYGQIRQDRAVMLNGFR